MLYVENLSKSLPDGRVLLDRVSFCVEPGEFVGILGASGAGKSLTLRCVLGLTQPDGGQARLRTRDGTDVVLTGASGRRLREARRRMGVIFQGFHLVKRLRVLDNVMIGRLGEISPWRSWFYGFNDREAAEALEALRRVKMDSCAERVTGTLSGGEMQRVAIARAIFQRPELFLADEPIASLDPESARNVMEILARINREHGVTILVSLHQVAYARRFCGRAIALRGGEVIHDGRADALSPETLRELYGPAADALLESPDDFAAAR